MLMNCKINRINEERIAAGKSVLGFLNPAMYANPGMFNDITNGTNPDCKSTLGLHNLILVVKADGYLGNTVGFSAVEGWDPVTGLGTPNYPKMLKYFMSLP